MCDGFPEPIQGVLEMKLFKPLLQEKFEHFCTASADGEGLMDFFRWLGSVDDPIEETSAVSAVVSDSEVLQVVCRTMLLVNPLERPWSEVFHFSGLVYFILNQHSVFITVLP